MRIGYKLVLGYVLIAALSGVTMYLANRSYHKIDLTFDDLSADTVPEIEALEELKLAALRIIASTSEYALIQAESSHTGKPSAQTETERDLISSGVENYNHALAKYEPSVDQNSNEGDYRREIKKHGADLIRIGAELVNDKAHRVTGDEVLEKKEEFEEAEEKFLAVADRALVDQHAQLAEKNGAMHSTVANAKLLTLVVFSLTICLSLTIGLYISRSMSRPINELKDASRKIGKGKLDTTITIRSNDEIGELAAAFNTMTDNLRQSQVEILAAKNFVENIIRSMTDLLIVTDVDGNITKTNSAATTLLGYEANALVGTTLEDILATKGTTHGGDLRAIEAAGSVESRCKRADGSEFPVLFSASVINDLQGLDLGFVCVAQDITELKEAENQLRVSLNEKEMLLKEIHHRVKNNMQVITSLLNLQGKQIKDEQARALFQDSQNRVKSMALIHESLYQTDDLSHIDFGEYLRKLIAHISRAYQIQAEAIQVKVNVEDIALGVDTAVPCGLIINELISNSLKHAFPAGTAGEILIDLAANGSSYKLTLSDNGIGFPRDLDIERAKTLGLKLVRSLTEQLQGELTCTNGHGTKFEITFPA
jgi:PAS domain S-box-containing protein